MLLKPEIHKASIGRLISEATSAATKSSSSDKPLAIAKEFRIKWNSELDKYGIKIITV
jgi:hypothetical protein